MPLGNRPSFSQVKAFFAGSNNLKDYYRGGPYVPNIAANNAISTTAAGLRLSQFSGADKVTAPPVPTVSDRTASDYRDSAGSASAAVMFRPNGQVWTEHENQGNYQEYTWLPAGRSASEYQIRTRSTGSSVWGSWLSLSVARSGAATSTSGDGFYDNYSEMTNDVQLGAGGVALTAVFICEARAQVRGRN